MNPAIVYLVELGSGAILVTALAVIWRHSLQAYIGAFRLQSFLLGAVAALLSQLQGSLELLGVALLIALVKGWFIPRFLRRLLARVGSGREVRPYLNVAASLLICGALVVVAYSATADLVAASRLPTRNGVPLALAVVLIGFFVLISRRQAITQVIGFLVLENGIAMLALMVSYGLPLMVELGVFLDVLIALWIMQVVVYRIRDTFDTLDVTRLKGLRH
ncbi:MAG TPA: hypothetical protein VGB99_18985 [Acidobacteriota bacterium]